MIFVLRMTQFFFNQLALWKKWEKELLSIAMDKIKITKSNKITYCGTTVCDNRYNHFKVYKTMGHILCRKKRLISNDFSGKNCRFFITIFFP